MTEKIKDNTRQAVPEVNENITDRTSHLSSDNTETATAIADAEKQPVAVDSVNEPIDPPPNGGYGWVVTAAQFFVIASIWGPAACYGIFLSYYRQNKCELQELRLFLY